MVGRRESCGETSFINRFSIGQDALGLQSSRDRRGGKNKSQTQLGICAKDSVDAGDTLVVYFTVCHIEKLCPNSRNLLGTCLRLLSAQQALSQGPAHHEQVTQRFIYVPIIDA